MNLDQHLNSFYKVCRYKKLQNYLLNDKSVNSYDINCSCNTSENIIQVNLLVSFQEKIAFRRVSFGKYESALHVLLILTKNIFK